MVDATVKQQRSSAPKFPHSSVMEALSPRGRAAVAIYAERLMNREFHANLAAIRRTSRRSA